MNGDSLDQTTTYVTAEPGQPTNMPPVQPARKPHLPHWRLAAVIAAVLILLAVVIFVLHGVSKPAKKPPTTVIINTQNLSPGTLSTLENENTNGSSVQQLTITPNTLFKNNTSVQDNLFVNGTTTVQGAATLNSSLTVTGGLRVGGSANVGGDLSVSGLITAKSLSVGTFTATSLHLTGDVNFGGHLVSSGAVPAITAGNGAGSGATASISGSDTAGTITIAMGSGGVSAGQLATITFHTPYGLSTQIQLTPVNAASAGLEYYVSQSAAYFTLDTATTPAPNATYAFNYLVTQ
jgi:hypothetical protein